MSKEIICRITFINVGNGDAVLLELPEKTGCFRMLIDGGSGEAGEYEASRTGRIRVSKYLEEKQVERIDCIVNTHIHEDHTCGLAEVAARWQPDEYWQPYPAQFWKSLPHICANLSAADAFPESEDKFLRAIDSYREICGLISGSGKIIRQITEKSRQVLPAGNCRIEVLGPEKETIDNCMSYFKRTFLADKGTMVINREMLRRLDAMMNRTSLVFLLNVKNVRVLLAGDMGAEGMKKLMKKSKPGDITVFKVGHHGQKNALDKETAQLIHTREAVISASSDRRYDSAHPEVLELLSKSGARLWFTDVPHLEPYTAGLDRHCAVRMDIFADGSRKMYYI